VNEAKRAYLLGWYRYHLEQPTEPNDRQIMTLLQVHGEPVVELEALGAGKLNFGSGPGFGGVFSRLISNNAARTAVVLLFVGRCLRHIINHFFAGNSINYDTRAVLQILTAVLLRSATVALL